MDRYTFENLKNEEVLVKFLERVWKAGFLTGTTIGCTYEEALARYMPKFKEELNKI